MTVLTTLALLFSVITFVFYVIGSTGYNISIQGYQTVAWIKSGNTYLPTDGIDLNYALSGGLRGYLLRITTTDITSDALQSFTASNWSKNSACKLTGYATAGLLITGLALIVISILFNAIVLSHEESAETQLYKGAAIVLSFLSFVVGVVGVTIFMDPFYGGCVHSLNNSTSLFGFFTYDYGPGSILATAGFSTALFAFLLNVASLKTSSPATTAASNVNYTPTNQSAAPNVEAGTATYT